MTHIYRRALVLLLALGGLLAVGASPGFAHTSLVRSSPADQSTVPTAPRTVTLTFDESIALPAVIAVSDANGTSVALGKTAVAANIASIRVGISAPGDYAVAYRVVSDDGHPVTGRLSFTVGAGSTHGRLPDRAVAVDHHPDSASSGPPTRAIGMVAALALLGGLALLTVRRWAPDLWKSS